MKTKNIVIIIILVALALTAYVRSYKWESYSLNYDEGATVWKLDKIKVKPLIMEYLTLQYMTVKEAGPDKGVDLVRDIYHSFPGYFVLAKLWLDGTELKQVQSLRTFSMIWSILTVPLIGLLALRFGKSVAIVAMLFALVHPMLQYFGTYIRFYSIFVFVCTVGLAMSVWVPYWLSQKTNSNSNSKYFSYTLIVLLAVATVLPIVFHLGGFVVSFAIFIIGALYLKNSLYGWIYYLTTAVISIIPALKSLFFLYMRAEDPNQASYIMSASSSHAIASLIFNYGIGVSLAAAAGIILIFFGRNNKPDDKYEILDIKYFSFSLVGAAIPMLFVIFIKPTIFRADYAIGLLPMVIVIASCFLVKIINEFSTRQSKMIGGVSFLIFALYPMLPTFISDLAIDGDRLDYRALVKKIDELSGGKPAIVYSDVPDYLEGVSVDSYKITYKHIKDYDHKQRTVPVYAVCREAKGFGNRFLPDLTTLNGPVRAIVGKNRLDHRLVRFYIVELSPGIKSN
jgi:hypothetical protein